MFSLYLSRDSGKDESKLVLGGIDKSLYTGDINWHKITDKYYWTVKADNILVDGKDIGLCKNKCNVVADTGTSLLTGIIKFSIYSIYL
jgi:cathepsin D